MASSSSSPLLKYDVFLSFRGKDTRDNIVSHLLKALERTKLETFIDYELEKGDEISPALIRAIKLSKISVIIFSKNYADSRWCLDELVKILECKKEQKQMVIPVFYKVEPTDVRKQTGEFGAAFLQTIAASRSGKEQEWRNALTEAANLCGSDSSSIGSMLCRAEAALLESIIADVLKKLEMSSTNSYDDTGLVGISSRMEKIISLLSIGSADFGMVGIWGMGGIGKTTIAKAVFNKISCEFESCCFLENIRLKEKTEGLASMRSNLISELLKVEKSAFTRERLRRTRVLIVLDDVDDPLQLENLIGASVTDQYGQGSRVMVTTRNKQILKAHDIADDAIYSMEMLQDNEALQLFSYRAFPQNTHVEPYLEFSKKMVEYAKGVPLALKVLASSLRGKTDPQIWEGALKKLRNVPDRTISDVLKISYDSLGDEEKNIFLDIACFFRDTSIDTVRNVLDGCYSSLHSGMDVLLDKSLISYRKISNSDWSEDASYDAVEMHDLVQEMGWNIVIGESKNAGSRSRLWRPEEVRDVLTRNTGTENIKGILFDVSKVDEMSLAPEIFDKMYNLKFLKIMDPSIAYTFEDMRLFPELDIHNLVSQSKIEFASGLNSLPNGLKYLYWQNYPLEYLPPTFIPKNLVELHLIDGALEQLWSGTQDLCNLKVLTVRLCEDLTEIPNLSQAKNLEELRIKSCDKLIEITSSLQYLSNLKRLNLFDSHSLLEITSFIPRTSSLTHLNMAYCVRLVEISSSIHHLKNLTKLDLSHCDGLMEIFPSVARLNNLTHLDLSWYMNLVEIPCSIRHLNNLTHLSLEGCESLVEISSSISHLNKLTHLNLSFCKSLVELPSTIGYLNNLIELDLSHCATLKRLPIGIDCVSLSLNDSKKIIKFPYLSKNIKFLYVDGTLMERDLSSIASFTELVGLRLGNCTDYQRSTIFLGKIKVLTPSLCEVIIME